MAEVIGLALSVASIAGLFSTCVDAFNLITIGKDFSDDYRILVTMLDVERARLLQWGEGVGLLDDEHRSSQLCSPQTGPVVEEVLHCIKLLLTKSQELQTRYGLSQCDAAATEAGETMAVSSKRLQRFREDYAAFQARLRKHRKVTETTKKFTWAITDCDKFRRLVQDLSHFISKLNEIVTINPQFRRLMTAEDVDSLPDDLRQLRIVESACKERDDEWSEIASKRVEASEMASQDLRDIAEWLHDVHSLRSSDAVLKTVPGFQSNASIGSSIAKSPDFVPLQMHSYACFHEKRCTSDREYEDIDSLERHLFEMHFVLSNIFVCGSCQKGCVSLRGLRDHFLKHFSDIRHVDKISYCMVSYEAYVSDMEKADGKGKERFAFAGALQRPRTKAPRISQAQRLAVQRECFQSKTIVKGLLVGQSYNDSSNMKPVIHSPL